MVVFTNTNKTTSKRKSGRRRKRKRQGREKGWKGERASEQERRGGGMRQTDQYADRQTKGCCW